LAYHRIKFVPVKISAVATEIQMESLFQDVRYGIRVLRKSPGFALVAILTLALGVGVNASMFGIFSTFLLKPLPFKDAGRIVVISESRTGMLVTQFPVELADFRLVRSQSQTLQSVALFEKITPQTADLGAVKKVEGVACSANLFDLLGVHIPTGRNFTEDETHEGANQVVLVSHSFALDRFGDPGKALGKTLTLDGKDHIVIGVLSAGFRLPNLNGGGTRFKPSVVLPFDTEKITKPEKFVFDMANMIGKLRSGVTLEQGRSELNVLGKSFGGDDPRSMPQFAGISMLPLEKEDRSSDMPRILSLFQFAVGFVLLIACANIANLMLARSTQRRREIVIRMAIGASRGRLFLQLLTESLTLGVAGSAIGLGLAVWLIRLVNGTAPADFLQGYQVALDYRVFFFTMFAGTLTSILFGLPPAFHLIKQDLHEALLQTGRTLAEHSGKSRSVLVVVELALALVLLVGAGLMIRTLWTISHVQPGFRIDNLLTANIDLPYARYQSYKTIVGFDNQVLEKVRALPGVESATIAGSLPMDIIELSVFTADGEHGQKPQSADTVSIRDDYFHTMGIGLIAGRDFTPEEISNQSHVVIVSEGLANKLWPKENPLGRRITFETDKPATGENGEYHVIAVAHDTHDFGLDSAPTTDIYRASQVSRPILMLHTRAQPAQLAKTIARLVSDIDKDVPVGELRSMREIVDSSLEGRRFQMWLFVAFSGLAIAMAGVGLYGVLAYVVSMRTREIGIRMALGAQVRDVIRLVVRHGLGLALIGLGVGLAASFALSRLMASMVYGVTTFDPVTYIGTTALLLLVAIAACYLPARRAARVDPMVALRYE
jgi:putative ABC transport system permease protein